MSLNYQSHPYHLVSPSPWPLYTSISLLSLTTSGALSMHLFNNSYKIFFIAMFLLITSMSLWFRDIIAEGTKLINKLYIAKSITTEEITEIKKRNAKDKMINAEQLGYYLAGLLEGDGTIYIPSLDVTTLNRILNPRIVFTSHINDINMYIKIQEALGGIGRFQKSGDNVLRYIIGNTRGLNLFIHVIHNKLRTPKNKTFNQLINFLNLKYNWEIPESKLDNTSFLSNSWLAGFTEANGHFRVKIINFKPKLKGARLRSTSESINIKYVIAQRYYDEKTSLSMLDIMEKLAKDLNTNIYTYINSNNYSILTISIVSIDKLKLIVDYFTKHHLLGIKNKNYQNWLKTYLLIVNKQHLTEKGKSEIKLLKSNMNN